MKTTTKTGLMLIILLAFTINLNAQKKDVAIKNQFKEGAQQYIASYFGGDATEFCEAIALDEEGNIFVTGYTNSTNFPSKTNSFNSVSKGKNDLFILKFDKDLKTILASATIGGSEDDAAYSIIYDKRGYVFIAGYTGSKDFPTTQSAYAQKYYGGKGDAFILKMDKNLQTLVSSTFLGGSGDENDFRSPEIVQDNKGNIYIAGITNSVDFPTTAGTFSEKYNGGSMDIFVSKLDSELGKLLASTLLGGDSDDRMGRSLAIDKKGNEIVLAGYTVSLNFPLTSNAYSKFISGELDGFVAKFSSDLTKLNASTMLNGWIYSMFVHDNGDIYVGGHGKPTTTPNVYCQFSDKGGDQGFISRFSNDLSILKSSTLLPGSYHSNAGEIAALNLTQSPDGNIISTGWVSPINFPVTPGAYDETQNGGNDTYLLKMDKDLSVLLASTFVGGSKNERWNRLATDKKGNIYVASYTASTDFPTTIGSAFAKFNGGPTDGFIVKLNSKLASDVREDFHNAAKKDDLKLIKRLLSANNALLEKPDRYNRTALHAASRFGALEVTKFLLNKGANISAKDESGNTPLHLASMYGHDKVAEFLVNNNANINAENNEGLSPLYLANYYGNPSTMDILLSKGADMSKKDKDGNTILHLAVLFGNTENIQQIMKFKPQVDAGNNLGSTPLHFAVRNDKNEKLVNLLIENGANPSAIDSTGKNALFLIGAFDTGIAKLLIQKGIKINAQDNAGNTVLQNSLQMVLNFRTFDPLVGNRMKDKLKMFMENGADPNIKNNKDKSATDMANEIGDKELIDLLKAQK